MTTVPTQTPPQSLNEWLTYISAQHSAEIVMGLDRVREVWQRMGSPRAPINITVGGTNGKGSTCAMLECMLRTAGYATGFFSSPHIQRYNERVRIGGESAADDLLTASFDAVERARQQAPIVPLTYFEFSALSALWCFAREEVEVAVLEVGMGGRLDAVNIVDPDVSIVVSVDLDHQAYLGDTIEKIAFEKAHIYRANRPAIFADAVVPDSLRDYATQIGADLIVLGKDYRFEKMEQQWSWLGSVDGIAIAKYSLPFPALRGSYQLKNASAAVAALTCLADRLPVSLGHIKRGLLEVEWPGRMQVLPGQPTVVLDVAHNPHAARALDDALGGMAYHPNTYAVFGMLRDKDLAGVIGLLKHRVDHWFVAGLPGERGTRADEIGDALTARGITLFSQHASIATAYAAAREKATPNDRILVFGSFTTVAAVLDTL